MTDQLILKPAPPKESTPVAEPKPTTIHPVDPAEYRTAALAAIGEGEADPNDESLPYVPHARPITGRLPEPAAGSLEAAVLALRRGTRDAGDLFDMEPKG